MTETWALAALWIGLALFAALASIGLRVATALSEIVVGMLAQFVIGGLFGAALKPSRPCLACRTRWWTRRSTRCWSQR